MEADHRGHRHSRPPERPQQQCRSSGKSSPVDMQKAPKLTTSEYAIAEKQTNSGSYTWKVSTDIAPSDGAAGYGIQLIDDATGQYQYSTQFGIANPDYSAPSSSHGSGSWPGSWSTSSATESCSTATASSTTYNETTTQPYTVSPVATGTASTGWYPGNSTVVQPTGPLTVPSSLLTATASVWTSTSEAPSATVSTSARPTTNAAGTVATSLAGLVVAAGVAVFAL